MPHFYGINSKGVTDVFNQKFFYNCNISNSSGLDYHEQRVFFSA